MEEKYFLHRIQKDGETYTKGIEVHDTLDSAIRSFWGRMKTGYSNPENPNIKFVHCKITDNYGEVVDNYNMSWRKDGEDGNAYFTHHIKLDGSTIEKAIDDFADFDAARLAYARYLEYGYNNPKFPNLAYISCEITDMSGSVLLPFKGVWEKTENAEG